MATRSNHPDEPEIPPQDPPQAPAETPPEELSAEPTQPPASETVEDVTAAEAAVASYRRNNPDESGEGE